MSEQAVPPKFGQAHTDAVRRAVDKVRDHTVLSDLLFLEHWEMAPVAGAAAALRIAQIRRANPELAAAVRTEIAQRRQETARVRVA